MVQISTSTVVVAVLAASALAAPAVYDAEDMSLSRREPLLPKVSGIRSAISNKVNKLKGAVHGLKKDERKEKNRLAKDISTGNFRDARKAENAISRDKAGIRNDKSKERVLETAATDLSSRDIDDFEYELVRRNPPTGTPKSQTPKPKKTKAQRKAARKGRLDAAVNKENAVLKGKAKGDVQSLRGERQKLDKDIASGNFAALKGDEAAIQKTKGDLKTVKQDEALLQQVEKANLRREFDDEFELEAREFDDYEELVRRVPPVSPKPKTKSTTKPKKTQAQRKAARKGRLDAAVNKETGVLKTKAKGDRQALRGERQKLDKDIASGNFAALKGDEAAIQKTKGDLKTVKQDEALLQQVENANLRREFDDEFELEARDFDDEYELEARDFDDIEERGFDDYELEMLD